MAKWQFDKRIIKWVRRLTIVAAVLVALYLLPSLLLRISSVQRWAGHRASEALSELLATPVSIERVSMEGWRNVSLDGLTIQDHECLPILQARRILGGMDLYELIVHDRVLITSIRLFDVDLYIDYDTTAHRHNIDHIIAALSNPKQDDASLHLNINNILVRNAQASYSHNRAVEYRIRDLDLMVSLLEVQAGEVSGWLDELKFGTPQGFRLDHLASGVHFADGRLELTDLDLRLPNSTIALPCVELQLGRRGLAMLSALEIDTCSLLLGDLAPLIPQLAPLETERLVLEAQVHRLPTRLTTQGLRLELGDMALVRGEVSVGLGRSGEAVEGLHASALSIQLAPELTQALGQVLGNEAIGTASALGRVSYEGDLEFAPDHHLTTTGTLTTELGAWRLSEGVITLPHGSVERIKARLETQGFDLTPLMPQGLRLEHLAGSIDCDIPLGPPTTMGAGYARVDLGRLDVAGHTYTGIRASAESRGRGQYLVSLDADDPLASLHATGQFAVAPEGIRDLRLQISEAEIAREVVPSPEALSSEIQHLGVQGELSVSRLDLDRAEVRVHLPKLFIRTPSSPIDLGGLRLSMIGDYHDRHITLSAPWGALALHGHYRLSLLPQTLLHGLCRQVPILQSLAPHLDKQHEDTDIQLVAHLDSIPRHLSTVLDLPIEVLGRLVLSGHYGAGGDSLTTTLEADRLLLAGHELRDTRLHVHEHGAELSTDATLAGGGVFSGAGLRLQVQDNSLRAWIDLGLDADGSEHGRLHLTGDLSAPTPTLRSLRDLHATIQIFPSRLRIHTAYWDIEPAQIWLGSGLVRLEGLQLSTQGRRIKAEGGLGMGMTQGLNVDIQNINLRYILEAVGVELDLLDTDLTGTVRASMLNGTIQANAQVTSPGFHILGHNAGGIDVGLSWNSEDLLIRLLGDVRQPHGGQSKVAGWIKPADGAGIDLRFAADSLDVSFVGRFMDNILDSLKGYGTGEMRLHGLFDDGVTVSGTAQVEHGEVGIKVLGTRYYFDHQLHLEDERILLDSIRLRDAYGHTGLLIGEIRHRYFDAFDLDLRARQLDRMLVLRTTTPKDMPVYGTAYASGNATIRGGADRLNIDVGLRSERGTELTLDFNPTTAGKDEQVMRFTRLRPYSTLEAQPAEPTEVVGTSSPIDMQLRLTITPEAHLGIRLATDMSNEIRGRAEGDLQINAPSQGEAEVYGTLSVLDGVFTFRFEQLAHKRFLLREGGQIQFRGNPTQANVALSAVYALTANISDLDEGLSAMAGRTNIPVHCILGLSGSISHPDINFALELPGVDSDIERRVRALLNTQDAVTRQMLYLIALGKFYTEESATRSTATTDSWTAAASSAISEQLSYLLGNLSKTIRLGTSIKTRNTAFDDTDIELLFSGSWLGNRLLVSGNIGYHDNLYLNNTYLGEFDIEYKLNRSGSLRFKGYNKYNNMYQYLRQSLMTQGFGVLFRQRFDRLSDIFRSPRRPQPTRTDSLQMHSATAPPTLQPSPTEPEQGEAID